MRSTFKPRQSTSQAADNSREKIKDATYVYGMSKMTIENKIFSQVNNPIPKNPDDTNPKNPKPVHFSYPRKPIFPTHPGSQLLIGCRYYPKVCKKPILRWFVSENKCHYGLFQVRQRTLNRPLFPPPEKTLHPR